MEGLWGATLGHGLVDPEELAQKQDARNHEFYGDYDAVSAALDALIPSSEGLVSCRGAANVVKRGWFIPVPRERGLGALRSGYLT